MVEVVFIIFNDPKNKIFVIYTNKYNKNNCLMARLEIQLLEFKYKFTYNNFILNIFYKYIPKYQNKRLKHSQIIS